MAIIDAQIHLWQGEGAPPHHIRSPYPVETALNDMAAAGVDRAVNCPAIWDPTANDYAVTAATAHPGRFATMAWFPLTPASDPAIVHDTLGAPGTVGLRFLLIDDTEIAQVAAGAMDWLWSVADQLEAPVALMTLPQHLPLVGLLASRFPRMRLMIDHLGVLPFLKIPDATAHWDALLELAEHPNIAVKATGVPSMATDGYPFESTHDALRHVYRSFGAERMFWGTDITRMRCSWRECRDMFTEHLPWLGGRSLELVMGDAIAAWLNWP